MIQGIKNLLFDFGGVLVDLDRERCIRAFNQLGFDLRPCLGDYAQNGIFSQLERGQLTLPQFCEALRNQSGLSTITDEQIIAAWRQFLLTIPDERLDSLIRLRERFPLYLLSNTNEVHWEMAQNDLFLYKGNTVDDFFKQIFLSYELGIEKPSPAIFQAVLDGTGICAEETLFIDDAEVNCEAARALGFKVYCPKTPGCWIDYLEKEESEA